MRPLLKKGGDKLHLRMVSGKHLSLIQCRFEKGCKVSKQHHLSEQSVYVLKGTLKIRV